MGKEKGNSNGLDAYGLVFHDRMAIVEDFGGMEYIEDRDAEDALDQSVDPHSSRMYSRVQFHRISAP